MNHEEWQILVSAYYDDEVTPAERGLVEAHLAECTECTATLAAYRRLGRTVQAMPRGVPSRELWPRVRQAITPRRGLSLWRRLLPLVSTVATLVVGITVVLILSSGPQTLGQQGVAQDEAVALPPAAEKAAPTDSRAAPPAEPTAAAAPSPVPEAGFEQETGAPPAGIAPASLPPCPGQPLPLEVTSLSVRTDAALSSPRLSGTLYDDEGKPLADVTLIVTATAGWQGSTATNADGTFSVDLPAEGSYKVVLALTEEETAANYDAWEESSVGEEREVELPEMGRCMAPLTTALPPIILGPQDEAVLTLQVR